LDRGMSVLLRRGYQYVGEWLAMMQRPLGVMS
jgi:hypothetical protein